jgi:hypothetical protein
MKNRNFAEIVEIIDCISAMEVLKRFGKDDLLVLSQLIIKQLKRVV